MDHFYFVRHGLTDANAKKLLCGGDWDIPLNAEGLAQAAQAAVDLKKALSSIRAICCSPLVRARQTAASFATELQVPVITLEDFREQRLGNWEKKPWQDVPEFFAGTMDPPKGETRQHFDARIRKGIGLALQTEGPVLIVSHGAVWYAMQRIFSLPAEEPGSCRVFHFQWQGQTYQRSKVLP